MSALKPDEYKAFVEEIGLAGNWMHGTHVAGIAVAGNPYARLVVGRIEFDWHLIPDPCPTRELTLREARNAQSVRRLLQAAGRARGEHELGRQRERHRATRSSSATSARRPTSARRSRASTSISRRMRSPRLSQARPISCSSPPRETATRTPPSSRTSRPGIVLPNLLTVGAVDKAGDEASFTSYGPTVKVHANGYQVESVIPGGEKLAESGTSMASPQVVNLAAKILAVNPKLAPSQVIALIRDNADKTLGRPPHADQPEEDARCRTGGEGQLMPWPNYLLDDALTSGAPGCCSGRRKPLLQRRNIREKRAGQLRLYRAPACRHCVYVCGRWQSRQRSSVVANRPPFTAEIDLRSDGDPTTIRS